MPLPSYLEKAVPTSASQRTPWFKNIAPTYAGIFLWIAFYNQLAAGTITRGTIPILMLSLAAAGIICYLLFYYVPATLGRMTGYPLYVLGSSTFGTEGGKLMPGILMGLLQVGWFAVGTFFAAKFVLGAFGSNAGPGSLPFILVGVVWGYAMTWIGVMGIQYVARIATWLNFIPLLMLIYVFTQTSSGLSSHVPSAPNNFIAFTLLIQIVVGFFATAGAAGADFGSTSSSQDDVRKGGWVGIILAVLIAGGLPLLSVAGGNALNRQLPNLNYDTVVQAFGGGLSSIMFLLFTLASVPAACFCALIAANSFSTMIPSLPRLTSTMAMMTIAIILAVTGAAENLIGFFTIVGASFGPICGAMAADYFRSGRRWAGPRQGINWAGYLAWAVGLLVGLIPFLPVSEELKTTCQPAAVYSCVAGFAVYWLAAAAGLEPRAVSMPGTPELKRAKA